jgi:hypothetical protein
MLYLYAYCLATERRHRDCQQVLMRLMSAMEERPEWEAMAAQAMYSIGHVLLRNQACQMALHCFEFVRTKTPETSEAHLGALLEECRFRELLTVLFDGRYEEFLSAAAEFRETIDDEARLAACDYYCMLARLHQGDDEGAAALLSSLLRHRPGDPRCLYHRLVLELRQGHRSDARRTMEQLVRMPRLPGHLLAGLETVKAYLKAHKGQLRDAEAILARITASAPDILGAEEVRRQATETRILCLCHLQETERIAPLVQDLPEPVRISAALAQAAAAVERGHLDRARRTLAPYAKHTPEVAKLYLSVSLALAEEALDRTGPAGARDMLANVPDLPRRLAEMRTALDVSARLEPTEDPATVGNQVAVLSGALETVRDPLVKHLLTHDLAATRLRECILAEAEPEQRAPGELYQLWVSCLGFWEEHVFGARHYWQRELALFSDPEHPPRPFSESETKALVKAMRDDELAEILMSYVLADLASSRERALLRHLDLLQEFGKSADRVAAYFAQLSKRVHQFLQEQGKEDVRLESWEFRITALLARMRLADVLDENRAGMEEELRLLRECRQHYDSPEEYRETRKRFNTLLLDALQLGAMGSFTNAGSKLEKLLRAVPAGMELGKTQDVLYVLRESCRKPDESLGRGVDLTGEFEKLYATVRDHASKPMGSP